MNPPAALVARMNRPCTVHTITPSGTSDAFGNPVPTSTPADTFCCWREARAEERTVGGDVAVTEYRVHLPAGTAVSASSSITVDGITMQVVGTPHVATDPLDGDVWFVRCAAVNAAAS